MINRVDGNDYYDYKKLSMPTSSEMTGNGEKFSLDYQRTEDEKDEDEGKKKISKEEMGNNLAGNGARTVVQGGVKLELSGESQRNNPTGRGNTFSALLETVRSWAAAFIQSFKGLLDKIWNDPAPKEEVLSTEGVPIEETDRLSEEYLDINPLEAEKADFSGSTMDNRTELHMPGNSFNNVQGNPYNDLQVEKVRNPDIQENRDRQFTAGRMNTDREIQKYLRSGNLEQVINLLTDNGQRTIARNSSLLTYYDRTGKLTSLSASDQERILHGDRNTRKL